MCNQEYLLPLPYSQPDSADGSAVAVPSMVQVCHDNHIEWN